MNNLCSYIGSYVYYELHITTKIAINFSLKFKAFNINLSTLALYWTEELDIGSFTYLVGLI